MEIIKKDSYTLVNVKSGNFNTFFSIFEEKFNKIEKNNLILNFNTDFSFKTEEILLLLSYSDIQNSNELSFVLVLPTIADIENYPERLNITPTIEEAEDLIEMELIERDLGF